VSEVGYRTGDMIALCIQTCAVDKRRWVGWGELLISGNGRRWAGSK